MRTTRHHTSRAKKALKDIPKDKLKKMNLVISTIMTMTKARIYEINGEKVVVDG